MGLTLAWRTFHGFGVGVVFYPLIDVGVSILATGTQITRNLATQTSISRNAATPTQNPRKAGHADVDSKETRPRERRSRGTPPRQRKTQGTRHVGANHGSGPRMPKTRPPPTGFGIDPKSERRVQAHDARGDSRYLRGGSGELGCSGTATTAQAAAGVRAASGQHRKASPNRKPEQRED